MEHKISEIQIVPIKPNNGLVGFASFVFDDCLYCGSIGIHTRPEGGYRLTYPTQKRQMGNFPIFHPINREISSEIDGAIIACFENVTKPYDRHQCVVTQ